MAFNDNDKIPEYKPEDEIFYESFSTPPRSELFRTKILQNREVPFVQRILNADRYPSRVPTAPLESFYLDTGMITKDGTVYGSGDVYGKAGNETEEGRHFVFPRVQYIDGKWVENEDPSLAVSRNNVIFFEEFPDATRNMMDTEGFRDIAPFELEKLLMRR